MKFWKPYRQRSYGSGVVHTSKTFEDYLVLIDEKDIDFTAARAGMKRTFEDGTVLEILSPDSPSEDDLNNASIVARLTYGKVSFSLPEMRKYLLKMPCWMQCLPCEALY